MPPSPDRMPRARAPGQEGLLRDRSLHKFIQGQNSRLKIGQVHVCCSTCSWALNWTICVSRRAFCWCSSSISCSRRSRDSRARSRLRNVRFHALGETPGGGVVGLLVRRLVAYTLASGALDPWETGNGNSIEVDETPDNAMGEMTPGVMVNFGSLNGSNNAAMARVGWEMAVWTGWASAETCRSCSILDMYSFRRAKCSFDMSGTGSVMTELAADASGVDQDSICVNDIDKWRLTSGARRGAGKCRNGRSRCIGHGEQSRTRRKNCFAMAGHCRSLNRLLSSWMKLDLRVCACGVKCTRATECHPKLAWHLCLALAMASLRWLFQVHLFMLKLSLSLDPYVTQHAQPRCRLHPRMCHCC